MILGIVFVKGRNLLVAIICHGIIDGLYKSLTASSAHPGMRQYLDYLTPDGGTQLHLLWVTCLFIGLVLLSFIPRKNINAH